MPTQAQVEDAIRRLGDLGVEVHISEMDVPLWYLGSTLERKLARQAQVYRAVAAACNAQPACIRITTWGFTDRYTWRLPWGQSLPLPFDSEYRPKAAWVAIQEVLRSASPTPPPSPQPPPQAEQPPPAQPATAAASAQTGAAPAAAPATPAPLSLMAKLRRQRLRTWLARRALAVVLRVGGSQTASVELVAQVRGRVIGRAIVAIGDAQRHSVRLSLTSIGSRRLRDAGAARVVLAAVATGADGRKTQVTSRVRAS
jgi:hypothetical protein